jgi:hypothetical protein
MKSVLLILTTVTSALAVLVVTIAATQSQNAAAFNEKNNLLNFNSHDHTQISEKHGIKCNDGTVYDNANIHQNDNFNTKRGYAFNERTKSNFHSKTNNDK